MRLQVLIIEGSLEEALSGVSNECFNHIYCRLWAHISTAYTIRDLLEHVVSRKDTGTTTNDGSIIFRGGFWNNVWSDWSNWPTSNLQTDTKQIAKTLNLIIKVPII